MTEIEAKLPTKIKVGGEVFSVEWVEKDTLKSDEGLASNGLTDLDNNIIQLEKGQTLQRLVDTVRHEVTHAGNSVYGVQDGMTEEDFTERSTKAWNDVFLHNPKLVTWLNLTVRELRRSRRTRRDAPKSSGQSHGV